MVSVAQWWSAGLWLRRLGVRVPSLTPAALPLAVAFLVLGVPAGAGLAQPPRPDSWPQLGGPHRNFRVESAAVAATWGENGPARLWSRRLGEGYSSILADGDLLVTMYRAGRRGGGRRARRSDRRHALAACQPRAARPQRLFRRLAEFRRSRALLHAADRRRDGVRRRRRRPVPRARQADRRAALDARPRRGVRRGRIQRLRIEPHRVRLDRRSPLGRQRAGRGGVRPGDRRDGVAQPRLSTSRPARPC